MRIENLDDDLYFHNRFIDIPQTNWRIIVVTMVGMIIRFQRMKVM